MGKDAQTGSSTPEAPQEDAAMQFGKGLVNKLLGKAAIASAALGAMLLFAGAPAATAADHDDCAKRIRKAEKKLHEAIEHHGYYSRQADKARHKRREAYERCDAYGGYGYRDRDYRYRDGGWYDRDGNYHDRDGGWYDRDGRYHRRDDWRYDR
jgi:hypothetical protein